MNRVRCTQHPWHARRDCRACLGDHKAGEHHGRPSSDCPACRVYTRLAEMNLERELLDARRRQANDHQ